LNNIPQDFNKKLVDSMLHRCEDVIAAKGDLELILRIGFLFCPSFVE